jgi:hypothetical protein
MAKFSGDDVSRNATALLDAVQRRKVGLEGIPKRGPKFPKG